MASNEKHFFLCFLYVLEFVGCVVDYAHYVTRKTSVSSKSASQEIVVIEIGNSNLVLDGISFRIRYSMNDQNQQVETKETTNKLTISTSWTLILMYLQEVSSMGREVKKKQRRSFRSISYMALDHLHIWCWNSKPWALHSLFSVFLCVYVVVVFSLWAKYTHFFFSTFRVVVIRLCILHHVHFLFFSSIYLIPPK